MSRQPTEITDRYMALKHPERYRELSAAIADAVTDALPENVSLDRVIEANRQRKIDYVEQYITDVSEALGLTGADLVDAAEAKRARRRGGQTRAAHHTDAIDAALLAFLAVDQRGGKHSEAVAEALAATEGTAHAPSEVTIRKWLAAVRVVPECQIQPPKRGRPKKKSS